MAQLKRSSALALVVLFVLLAVAPVLAAVTAGTDAGVIQLTPRSADLSGAFNAVVEPMQPPYNIGGWTRGDTVSWDVYIEEAGYYTFHIEYSRPGNYPAAAGNIWVDGENWGNTLPFVAEPTGVVGSDDDWSVYAVNSECGIDLEPGKYRIEVSPDSEADGPEYFINLRGITLATEGHIPSAASKTESETAGNSNPAGSGRVRDGAGIFTDAEEAELLATAEAYAANLGAHFVILTVDDASEENLEGFSRNFYETNIAGVNDIFECAMMTVNMGTRRVANDFYGELRTMISDDEASVIREGYTAALTNGDYAAAARDFLNESAVLVGAKLEEYRIDTPEADSSELVYDYANVLLEEERAQLVADARALSEIMGVPHFIVITGEHGDEDYLKRYASSFYKQNLEDIGGCLILTVSLDAVCAVSPFGSYLPENRLLWDMTSAVNSRLSYQSIYAGCRYFLGNQADKMQAANYEMPDMDLAQIVFDFTDSLTGEEEENLRREIGVVSAKYGVNLYIVMSDIASRETLSVFRDGFSKLIEGDWDRDNSVALIIGATPEIPGESREIYIVQKGKKTYRKIGYNQSGELRRTAGALAESGAAYDACLAFVGGAAKYLGSPIPNVAMVEELDRILVQSILVALLLPGLTILVMRLMHGSKRARKVPARSYMAKGGVSLVYSRDVFIGSHTTQTKIQKESSSSGGGSSGPSGSSGGGISSRSEGSF